MIETLNNIQPILIFFLMAFFFTLETFIPHLTQYRNRKKHTLRNLVLVLVCFVANGIAASWLTYWISVIRAHGLGLLNAVHLEPWAATVAGVLLIDLDSYVGHVLFHKAPWLWRFHRVHHSDIELDSTSSLRFHPLEVLAQAVWRTMSFALIGVLFSSFVVFYTLVLPLLFIQHANIKFPRWMDEYLGAVFVLSAWHKVHHSDEQRNTDSHYGNVFTLWDRVFGTSHRGVAIGQLTWGLKEFKEDRDQTLKSQLMLPFRNVR
jgi:sterol desaturase/sphingolipid hydroxylase (fatty acid hydroxylase superfamily)